MINNPKTNEEIYSLADYNARLNSKTVQFSSQAHLASISLQKKHTKPKNETVYQRK